MYKENISNEDVNLLSTVQFEGDIFVVTTPEQQKEAVDYLASCKIIGFDTESKPTFKKGVKDKISLVQLSSEDRAYLFRISKEPLIKDVLMLLQSSEILKIGLALSDDIKRIAVASKRFTPRGFIDLQKIVSNYGIKELGLKKISGIVLGSKISKAQRLSNWNAVTLTEAQKRYAATDAWVCVEIYKNLLNSNDNKDISKKG